MEHTPAVIAKKLERIRHFWNTYILEYKFCSSQIKFTEDVQSNYFGDKLVYLNDTLGVIHSHHSEQSYFDAIASNISFLQAIYVQQDFIEELLHIFRCQSDKASLKNDLHYTINRELRNELIGHPIRKNIIEGNLQLISSSIFSHSTTFDRIVYIRYHVNDIYKGQQLEVLRDDVLQRHYGFLVKYLDEVISRVQVILGRFDKKVNQLQIALQRAPFQKLVGYVGDCFEYIFNLDPLYKPHLLLRVYSQKDLGRRYENAIEKFLNDLQQAIYDVKSDVDSFMNYVEVDQDSVIQSYINIDPILPLIISAPVSSSSTISYQYEMGKMISRKTRWDLKFYSDGIREKCPDNTAVLAELDHMYNYFDDELEYYCSYHYIRYLLK